VEFPPAQNGYIEVISVVLRENSILSPISFGILRASAFEGKSLASILQNVTRR
jgi:hypothetical protein